MEEDMLIGDLKHNRSLYFIRYIHEMEVPQIQIDPGLSVNIIPTRVMTDIGIPNSALKETNFSNQGYNGRGDRAIRKV